MEQEISSSCPAGMNERQETYRNKQESEQRSVTLVECMLCHPRHCNIGRYLHGLGGAAGDGV